MRSQVSLVAQLGKNPPAMLETWVQSLGGEESLEKGKATHSSILAWRIPWNVSSMGSQKHRVSSVCFSSPKLHSLSFTCLPAKLLQSCPTHCEPIDCSPPGSSVHGILQARILRWVATPSSRGSSQPRDQTLVSYVSCTGRWFFLLPLAPPGKPVSSFIAQENDSAVLPDAQTPNPGVGFFLSDQPLTVCKSLLKCHLFFEFFPGYHSLNSPSFPDLKSKESWAQKNWCFWIVVLEKTLESPLDCKEIKPIHPKGNQSWVFIGRTDVEAETPIFWPHDAKSWLIWNDPDAGKDWRQEENGTTEDEMVGWHHWLNGHGFG